MTGPLTYAAIISRRPGAQLRGPEAAARASGLALGFSSDRVSLFLRPGATPILPLREGGVIVGHLFERHGSQLSREAAVAGSNDRPIDGGVGTILNRFWGGYVGFLSSADGKAVDVSRDPSGAVACYLIDTPDAVVATNDVSLGLSITDVSAEIDWIEVARHLLAPELPRRATCLRSVTELLPGSSATIGSVGTDSRAAWEPWQHVACSWGSHDAVIAATRVRDAVETTAAAWAKVHGSVLVELSGGLDSSILAQALSNRSRPFSAVTFYTNDGLGDERRYARAIAQACGVNLEESLLEAARVDLARSGAAHLPRPSGRLFTQEIDRLSLAAARRSGARAIVHGGGGDNVFGFLHSVTPIVDRYRVEGLSRATLRTAIDVAGVTECSLFEVAAGAVRRAAKSGSRYLWRPDPGFLKPEAAALADISHPWLEPPVGALPGKAAHIASIMRVQNYLTGFERERVMPVVAPLLSQPVIETCLAIPTWLWCRGGADRAIARDAFRGTLPSAILNRRTKGSPDRMVCQIFELNREAIRDRLLTGPLARSGMLDVNGLSAFLSNQHPVVDERYARVLMLIATDNWLSSWLGRGNPPSARIPGGLPAHVAPPPAVG